MAWQIRRNLCGDTPVVSNEEHAMHDACKLVADGFDRVDFRLPPARR